MKAIVSSANIDPLDHRHENLKREKGNGHDERSRLDMVPSTASPAEMLP